MRTASAPSVAESKKSRKGMAALPDSLTRAVDFMTSQLETVTKTIQLLDQRLSAQEDRMSRMQSIQSQLIRELVEVDDEDDDEYEE